VRLPIAAESIVARIRAQWSCAENPAADDYTDFWLVLADQLHG